MAFTYAFYTCKGKKNEKLKKKKYLRRNQRKNEVVIRYRNRRTTKLL